LTFPTQSNELITKTATSIIEKVKTTYGKNESLQASDKILFNVYFGLKIQIMLQRRMPKEPLS